MELKKVNYTWAEEICIDIQLSAEATEMLSSKQPPSAFLQQLLQENMTQDAIRFLARSLPRREATWWACLSARQIVDDSTAAENVTALDLAEQWVYKPNDDNRYAAYQAAENLQNENPMYWAAMAAFWSGGSMSPPDAPAVPPAEHICSLAVSGAVSLAGLSDDVKEAEKKYALFFKQGIAIANGENAKEVKA